MPLSFSDSLSQQIWNGRHWSFGRSSRFHAAKSTPLQWLAGPFTVFSWRAERAGIRRSGATVQLGPSLPLFGFTDHTQADIHTYTHTHHTLGWLPKQVIIWLKRKANARAESPRSQRHSNRRFQKSSGCRPTPCTVRLPDWRPEELIFLMSTRSKQSISFIYMTCHIVEILTIICPILD
jgi:hypothetical protein